MISSLFFSTFHFLFGMFLFPTLIALIVDAYSEIKKDEKSIVNRSVILKLAEEWKEVDQEGKGYIPYESFWKFYIRFLKIYKEKEKVFDFGDKERLLERLKLTVYESEGQYWFRFHEVIENLVKMYLEVKLSEAIVDNEVHRNFEKIYATDDDELAKTDIKSGEVPRLVLLKLMLKRWQEKSKA